MARREICLVWIMRENPLLDPQLRASLLTEEQEEFDLWPLRLPVRTTVGEWGASDLRESIPSY